MEIIKSQTRLPGSPNIILQTMTSVYSPVQKFLPCTSCRLGVKLETASLCIAQNKEVVGRLARLGDDGEKYQLIIRLVILCTLSQPILNVAFRHECVMSS